MHFHLQTGYSFGGSPILANGSLTGSWKGAAARGEHDSFIYSRVEPCEMENDEEGRIGHSGLPVRASSIPYS